MIGKNTGTIFDLKLYCIVRYQNGFGPNYDREIVVFRHPSLLHTIQMKETDYHDYPCNTDDRYCKYLIEGSYAFDAIGSRVTAEIKLIKLILDWKEYFEDV